MQQQAYCDESGKHNQASSFIMSGLVATKTIWDDLSGEWAAAISKYGVRCFHATDCEAGQGDFKGMSVEEREAIQEKLIRVMLRFKIPAVTSAIRRVDYEPVKHRLRTVKKYKSIYFLGFEAAVLEMLHAAKNSEVAFIFDRQKEFQGRAKELYDLLAQHPTFPHAARLGPLTFESKEKAIPLQASDLFAYESYRRVTEGNTRKARWQLRMLNEMNPKPRVSYLKRPILEKLANRMEKVRA